MVQADAVRLDKVNRGAAARTVLDVIRATADGWRRRVPRKEWNGAIEHVNGEAAIPEEEIAGHRAREEALEDGIARKRGLELRSEPRRPLSYACLELGKDSKITREDVRSICQQPTRR